MMKSIILLLLMTSSICAALSVYNVDDEGSAISNNSTGNSTELQALQTILQSLEKTSTENTTEGHLEFMEILKHFMARYDLLEQGGTTADNSTSVNGTLITKNLTISMMQKLLDTHNHMRMSIAKGLVKDQPSAADMMLMEWDDRLAATAKNWSDQCIGEHDTPDNRRVHGYSWIGQNLVGAWSYDIRSLMELWFEEHKYFNYWYTECKDEKKCGHYTQLGWAGTHLVGCSLQDCSHKLPYSALLVCNYAPGGNLDGRKPYQQGQACSKCPGEFTCCMDGLCATPEKCKLSGVKCNCTIKQDDCANGSVLDVDKCRCNCTGQNYGVRCQYTCEDVQPLCESMVPIGSSREEFCTSVFASQCVKFCGRCSDSIGDRLVKNVEGIVARVVV